MRRVRSCALNDIRIIIRDFPISRIIQVSDTLDISLVGGPKWDDVVLSPQVADEFIIALYTTSHPGGLMEKNLDSCLGGHWFDSRGRARVLDRDCKNLLGSEQGDSHARILMSLLYEYISRCYMNKTPAPKKSHPDFGPTSVSSPVCYFPQRCS